MAFVSLLTEPVIDFELHKSNFIWDTFLHFPVPTVSFVAQKIGVDLIEHTGSEAQAQNLLLQLSKVAKDYMMSRLPMNSREYQEFRLSRDISAVNEVLEFQMAFVIAATTTGSVYDLYSINRANIMKPGIAGIESAYSIMSGKFRTYERIPKDLYRVGY